VATFAPVSPFRHSTNLPTYRPPSAPLHAHWDERGDLVEGSLRQRAAMRARVGNAHAGRDHEGGEDEGKGGSLSPRVDKCRCDGGQDGEMDGERLNTDQEHRDRVEGQHRLPGIERREQLFPAQRVTDWQSCSSSPALRPPSTLHQC